MACLAELKPATSAEPDEELFNLTLALYQEGSDHAVRPLDERLIALFIGDLELHWPLCLLLHDHGACSDETAVAYIADSQLHRNFTPLVYPSIATTGESGQANRADMPGVVAVA